MIGRYKVSRCLVGAALLVAADFVGVTAIDVVLTSPAQAQFFGNDPNSFFGQRQRPRSGGGGGDSSVASSVESDMRIQSSRRR